MVVLISRQAWEAEPRQVEARVTRSGAARVVLCALACLPAGAGDLSERLQLTLDRVRKGGPPQYSPDFLLQDVTPQHVRRFTEYSGDVSGRYVGALAAALESGRAAPELDRLVPQILGWQKPEGYFGDPFQFDDAGPKEMRLLWGNGRLLTGLLEEHRRRPRPEILAAALRLAEFLLRIGPLMDSEPIRRRFEAKQFATGYICWTQNIEALAELYRLTRDDRWRRLAEQIAGRVERKPAEHAHGFLTSLRGIVALYEATGRAEFLARAEREWQAIVNGGEVTPAGGIPEAWRPNSIRTEGCGDADWVRLSLSLWRLTGQKKYLEMAERSIFNELALNQFETGDFGHRELTPNGVGQRNAVRAWWCCTLHGLRCLPEVREAAFRVRDDALFYDLPVDGAGKAAGLAAEAESTLGKDAQVRLSITAAGGRARAIHIRAPEWAAEVTLRINGVPRRTAVKEGYLTVRRRWKRGDRVAAACSLKTRAERKPDSNRIALVHGPWLLGIDEAGSPAYYEEMRGENRLAVTVGQDGTVSLPRAVRPRPGRFAVPVAQFSVTYAPGGYPLQPWKALLRPLAEQTGILSAEWEYWFVPAEPAGGVRAPQALRQAVQ
jgi:DUF1680 family protein